MSGFTCIEELLQVCKTTNVANLALEELNFAILIHLVTFWDWHIGDIDLI